MNDALHVIVEPELFGSSAVLAFEGWNDAGDAASLALRTLVDAIQGVPLARIDCETYYDFTVCRPEISETADSGLAIRWPTNEFRFGSIDPDRELVTFMGVEPHLRWRSFCDCVSEVIHRVGVTRVIMLGSYLADVVYSQPVQVTGFASNPEELEQLGVAASGYQGPTGILGVLAERFVAEKLDVVSLWAGLPHYINVRPNPRGALALLQKVVESLEMAIDVGPLHHSAVEFEEKISRLVASDPELSDYVKQLKRREFAQ